MRRCRCPGVELCPPSAKPRRWKRQCVMKCLFSGVGVLNAFLTYGDGSRNDILTVKKAM